MIPRYEEIGLKPCMFLYVVPGLKAGAIEMRI